MFHLRIKILLISLFVALTLSASTSSDAEKHYRAGEWAVADSLYAQLLKSSPNNRIYNHRYGVCLYEQRKDLAKAEKCLYKSKRAGIALSAFYLGRVCFLEYKFDDAISNYQYYQNRTNSKDKNQAITEGITRCEKGQSMLDRTEDIKILDRIEVNKTQFYNHYELSKEAGAFLNDAGAIDEDSIAPNSTIYQTERGDRVFFVLSENGKTNLYYKNRLIDHWSEKVALGENVNTEQDENYPFLMSDGIMLYFSSKGHNSFGGYDIFVTRYNASQNKYLPPQQLGMPFNSPGNDMLFVVDEFHNIGWFASDRDCEEGNIAIYTFVPNSTIKLLETKNESERRKAARISNEIIDTTENNVDEVAYWPNESQQAEERKINFIVNDSLRYSSINDFMSSDAQSTYLKYEATALQFDSISNTVANKRILYSKTSSSKEKADLITEITTLESKTYNLEEQRDQLLLTTRRIELETIRANGGYSKPKPEPVEEEINSQEEEIIDHVSPWETRPAEVTENKIDKPFFYNKTLYKYYDKIYSDEAIEKLITANKQKAKAANKQYLADYIMREYNKPEPEDGFYEKIFSYDTTFTPELSQQEMISKVKRISNESAKLLIEANYLSVYTLKGQNVLLSEKTKEEKYRSEMQDYMQRSAFKLQEANQQIYVSEGVYTRNKENLARGNNDLKESIKLLETTSLKYLQYLYDQQQELKAEKPIPDNYNTEEQIKEETTSPVQKTVERTEIESKQVKQEVLKEEYRIQVGSFSRILNESDINLPNLSYYKYPDKNLYRYFTGSYTNQMDAALGLEEVKAKGYKDAYVVKFENGIPVK